MSEHLLHAMVCFMQCWMSPPPPRLLRDSLRLVLNSLACNAEWDGTPSRSPLKEGEGWWTR